MITDSQLHILRHSLGLDDNGNGRIYRNHYCCDPEPDLTTLVAMGLMTDRGAQSMCGGMHVYHVTDAGRKRVMNSRPVLPKITRSQRRYRDYLNADLSCTFAEYLKHYDGRIPA